MTNCTSRMKKYTSRTDILTCRVFDSIKMGMEDTTPITISSSKNIHGCALMNLVYRINRAVTTRKAVMKAKLANRK